MPLDLPVGARRPLPHCWIDRAEAETRPPMSALFLTVQAACRAAPPGLWRLSWHASGRVARACFAGMWMYSRRGVPRPIGATIVSNHPPCHLRPLGQRYFAADTYASVDGLLKIGASKRPASSLTPLPWWTISAPPSCPCPSPFLSPLRPLCGQGRRCSL